MNKSTPPHIDQDLLDIYIKALRDQTHALRNSMRWKIGNWIVRQVERLLGRKKPVLALDHVDIILNRLLERSKIQDKVLPLQNEINWSQFPSTKTHGITSCAFVVSDSNWKTAIQGDVFTAWELAETCEQQFGWKIDLIQANNPKDSKHDMVISLLYEFDIRKLKSSDKKVAWVRSYAEYWIMKPWFEDFDFILCSSRKIERFLKLASNKEVFFFPIATNAERFAKGVKRTEYASDYSFTGSRWSVERNIEKWLLPSKLPFIFKVFGRGWEDHEKFGTHHLGRVSYQNIPDIYASTKLVLDDSNESTTKWESVNSRIFDALGIGKPVLTNNVNGFIDLFHSSIPTYNSKDELLNKIQQILSGPDSNQWSNVFEQLKEKVLANHTYRNRADDLSGILEFLFGYKLKIALKISVLESHSIESWGDYHFAASLSRAFKKLGHSVRIDIVQNWYQSDDETEVNIVLRGIRAFKPNPDKINLLWIISHPDLVNDDELNQFDHVFVASHLALKNIQERTQTTSSILLQCTDPELFFFEPTDLFPSFKRLYIANSRNSMRTAASYALESNIPMEVIGQGWHDLLPDEWIKGDLVQNAVLRYYYSNAKVIINDHWPYMLSSGFISNRIYDVLACGKYILSDKVLNIDENLKPFIITYNSSEDFKSKIELMESAEAMSSAQRNKLQSYIRENHSFENRVASILDKIFKIKNTHHK